MVKVIKKDGNKENFQTNKIEKAIQKSAQRTLCKLTEQDVNEVCDKVLKTLADLKLEEVEVNQLHNIVEKCLTEVNPEVGASYKEYRNYKTDFVSMLDEVYEKAQKIMYLGDKENSNTDSTLVSTKRSLIYNELNRELYKKFFLNSEEKQAKKDGYIYIHDESARRDCPNCCLFDAKTVMTGGFEMGNMWYNEPQSIDTACDVLGDIIMMSASMQYGGWSTRIDNLLAPYVEKSHKMYISEINEALKQFKIPFVKFFIGRKNGKKIISDWAFKKAIRDLEQGAQGLEYKLNSVASSRGDYPFTTFALGLGEDKYEQEVSKAFLKVRMEGQGKEGKKRQVLFPKLVFLYDEELHGKGKKLEHIFNIGVDCSSKSMYPDWLSLSGLGFVPEMYKKYGEVVYPMGQQLVA